jgi:glycerophosphoryl diester phosphodiesterase
VAAACGGAPGSSGGDARASDAAAGGGDGAAIDGAAIDGPAGIADARATPDGGTYRNSLSVCWTDASCPRVMAIGHGGAWDLSEMPYDSDAAIAHAYDVGMDGVKIDVRVTKDDVPIIAHSSPIEIYESTDCYGQKIEEMTAAQVTACHRFPSSTQTFQRLDDVLDYLRGKMVVQLTVKLSSDDARTIQEVHADGAEDFAFLEISTSDLQNLIPTITGGDSVYYLIEVAGSYGEVDTVVALADPRAFMVEMDPDPQVAAIVTDKLHPANIRSFTYDSSATASAQELQDLYDQGFDVVSSQVGATGVTARMTVNQARGVSPP